MQILEKTVWCNFMRKAMLRVRKMTSLTNSKTPMKKVAAFFISSPNLSSLFTKAAIYPKLNDVASKDIIENYV